MAAFGLSSFSHSIDDHIHSSTAFQCSALLISLIGTAMHGTRRAFASRQRAAVSPNSELVDMVSSTEGFSQQHSITRLPCAAKLSTGDDTPPASRRAARMSQMLTAPLALPQATRLPQGDQEGAVSAEICAPTLRSSQLCAR